MDKATQIYIFARRYCIERSTFWREQYEPIDDSALNQMGSGRSYEYSDKAHNIYPRSNVLGAILTEVESLYPDDLPEFQQLVEYLIQAGNGAGSGMIANHDNRIAEAAEQDERDRFTEEIKRALMGDLPYQIPLFYRRVLGDSEVSELWERISKKWGAGGGYWYPLNDCTHPTLIALSPHTESNADRQKKLRDFIVESGETRIFELREHGPENFLVDVGVNDFLYNGAEGYWVPRSNEWIIYCSHEDTITLGGSIVSVVKETKVDYRDAWWKQT